jgi:hypothetical protein
MEEWQDYYYRNVKPETHIESLGRTLHKKIRTTIMQELESLTVEDCIDWMKNLVINRTYEGYEREIQVIRGVLQEKLPTIKIKEASDEWDRHYSVDYYIEVNGRFIGIQIKPLDIGVTKQVFARFVELQRAAHEEFESKYGGKVFYVFSSGEKGSKEIQNTEVIEDIRREIDRLSKAQ